ncbi:hypothetical protein AVEN_37880-1 [Araneus ventricosus]|uniref:Uncharacterized protein n=1 Tax=Araneus ventricosus TaxID=182803 RepID=A0A4Y2R2W3_ARAVE|nr:hypothetical protein AVEN_37880-1 [Araneus ventricosus]
MKPKKLLFLYPNLNTPVIEISEAWRDYSRNQADSTEEPPCKRVWCTLNPLRKMSSRWCGAEVWRRVPSGVVLVI